MSSECFLRNDKEMLLSNWEKLAKAELPSADEKSHKAILDHLPELIDALCVVIESKKFEPPKEISKTHGRQRFSFGDYSLAQVIKEYSLLKNLVYDRITTEPSLSLKEFRLIDHFFDSAVRTAATEFAKLRELDLKSTASKLEESHADLERFTGVAAHDLRSPAATIVGYAELLLSKTETQPELAKVVTVVDRTAKRMIQLIDQLLIYTKIGATQVGHSSFSLAASVDDALTSTGAEIREAKAKVHVGPLPQMVGDSVLMTQLFQNLITNSLKFRSLHRPCEISIDGGLKGHHLHIEFKDNGIGFQPELRGVIFEPFKRAHEKLKIQGSGIGLASVQRIVKLHHGTISAEGIENEGATFRMTFPV
jgi:signal transduction histidine kinase